MNSVYGLCLTLYVLLSILGILNIVTGMFVERASNISKIDRDFAISDEIHKMEADIQESVLLFQEMDKDRAGKVDVNTFMEFLTHERVIAYFATLDIDVTDRERLQFLFDVDADGRVGLEEFVIGCVRLRGSAKKSDLLSVSMDMQRLSSSIVTLDKTLSTLVRQVDYNGERVDALHEVVTERHDSNEKHWDSLMRSVGGRRPNSGAEAVQM
jgi:hypothetical protein